VNRIEYGSFFQSGRVDMFAETNSKSATALHIRCDRNDAEFCKSKISIVYLIDAENKKCSKI
jgi:hypothetical protein